jgi:peroxiredoxin Q/BCP
MARSPANDLEVGDRAPTFTLATAAGGRVALSDFRGEKLVIYFYPKADTPGCTTEALDFSRLKPRFARTGTAILGVSVDPVAAQDRFKAKHSLTIVLACDETREMLPAYGAWGKKMMYGRTFMGVIRKTVLIDGKGRIARIWPKVSVPGHAEEVLAAVKAL